MKLSLNGARFIGSFEGFVDHPYNDPVGLATIGYGHLLHYSPVTPEDVKHWGKITHEHGLEILQSDARRSTRAVQDFIKVPLTQGQQDALISFVFNCGVDSITGNVGRVVNSKPRKWNLLAMRQWHNRVGAALGAWIHAGGHTLPGLVRRRAAEARLFATGKYGV